MARWLGKPRLIHFTPRIFGWARACRGIHKTFGANLLQMCAEEKKVSVLTLQGLLWLIAIS